MTRRRSIRLAISIAIVAFFGAYFWFWRGRATNQAEAKFFLAGDVHFGAHSPKLGEVGAVLVRPSFGVVNLEGPTTLSSEDASQSRQERLLNATSGLASLASEGIRVVGVANNHARDISPNDSARRVREAGLHPIGAADFAIVETSAGHVVITAHELGVGDADLKEQLALARARGDFLITTFHVTGPPSYVPRRELRAAVDVAIAAGARVIAAHGTHAIGPVERRGDAVIAWGLGNLLFSCECTRETEGVVLEITIARDRQIHAAIIPIVAGLDGAPPHLDPTPELTFDLLKAIGSSPLDRKGPRALF